RPLILQLVGNVDGHGAAGFVGTSADIQRMQVMSECSAAVNLVDHIHRVRALIDHRSADNAVISGKVMATEVAADGRPEISVPIRSGPAGIIGVVSVYAVVDRRDVYDVVRSTADAHPRDDQRLAVNLIVHRPLE